MVTPAYNGTPRSLKCELRLDRSTEEMLEDFRGAKPYPHLVLDNLFPSETLDGLLQELPLMADGSGSAPWVRLGENALQFISFLHSAAFLSVLSEIAGIKALLPDPYLTGASYQEMAEGSHFEIHADRKTDHHSGLERRLAMFIYLNKDWKAEHGGQIELWNTAGTRCEREIEPIFNRTVILQIGDRNFHGVKPIGGPEGLSRRSFTAYFHTAGTNAFTQAATYAAKPSQSRGPLVNRVARDVLPPLLYRTLKRLRGKH